MLNVSSVFIKRGLLACIVVASSLLISAVKADSTYGSYPKTVVSNLPIYLLARELVGAENSKHIILLSSQSPHRMHLSPSSMRRLLSADYVLYLSPRFELFLNRLQGKRMGSYKTLSVLQAEGLELLSVSGTDSHNHDHEEDEHDHEEDDSHDDHGDHDVQVGVHDSKSFMPNVELPKNTDLHLWYSPKNLQAIAQWVSDWLGTVYQDKVGIQQRLDRFLERLYFKVDQIEKQFQDKQLSYVAFHPAYQYFEDFFNLSKQTFYLSSERISRPSSETAMRHALANPNLKCVLYDNPSTRKIVQKLVGNKQGKIIYLDPLGRNLLRKNQSILGLLDEITEALLQCVQD